MTGASPDMAKPTIREVSTAEVSELRGAHGNWKPDLGGRHSAEAAATEDLIAGLQNQMKEGATTFLVEWQGSKIPRGAAIDGIAIAWTQNGMVTGAGGEQLGTYERLVEFGGPSGREHKMLIFAQRGT